ncbi:MAG: M1 family metallopeptidase [Bacteroidia bacterium]
MLRKIIFLPTIFLLFCSELNAQDYFQQQVDYNIHVKLNDVSNELSAYETIGYLNNSSQTLDFIYMHLWPNGYKNDSTAMAKQMLESGNTTFYYSSADDKGYIDSLDFKVDGQPVKWEYAGDPSIVKIILNEPLKGGEKLILTTPFHVKIPNGKISRMGHIGQSYQISQWYPKPAVYDRNGWNQIPYLNQGEFYSEYGSFDVFITLPKNYVVGATGDLIDGEQEQEWLAENAQKTAAMTSLPTDMSFPPSDKETKTLHYHLSKIHDFAWFADKRYHVLKGEATLPHSGKKVSTYVMFTNANADLWKKSLQYMHDAIYYYSLWNGDYAYDVVTAVDGTISAGGGMEYPTITVIGAASNDFELETVIAHELGHNWFYGMLGSNERKHAWMDEGINSYYENRYLETVHPDAKLLGNFSSTKLAHDFDLSKYRHREEYYLTYLINAAKNEDQAIDLPAGDYTDINYAGDVYCKTALAFNYLMAYLGKPMMDSIMQTYFDTWKFKHPQPYDIQKIFDDVTGKDLSWFFDDLLETTKKIDYEIISSKKLDSAKGYDIVLKNTGQIIGPVSVAGIKNGKIRAIVWYDGFSGKKTLGFPTGEYDHFKIDYFEDIPEINRNNNTLRTSGILKRTEPFKLQFLGSIDDPDKTQLFFTPIIGWNNYNKFMLGAAFYNSILPQKKLEYIFTPMYAFGNKDLAGYAQIHYNITPDNDVFQQITLGINGARFDDASNPLNTDFNKIVPEILFKFKKKRARSNLQQTLRYRDINIIEGSVLYGESSSTYFPVEKTLHKMYNDVTYNVTNSRVINPCSAIVNFQQGDKMAKLSLTANFSFTLSKNKSIDFRIFSGTFIGTTATDAGPYAFRLSGETGSQDYLYDNVFLGRSEYTGILSQQMTETDGDFKMFTALGQSTGSLVSMNVKSSLPISPLRIYADLGASSDDYFAKAPPLYDIGIDLPIAKNIFEIYFPLFYSQDIKNEITANNLKYFQTVRFTLNFNLMNPLNIIKNLSL